MQLSPRLAALSLLVVVASDVQSASGQTNPVPGAAPSSKGDAKAMAPDESNVVVRVGEASLGRGEVERRLQRLSKFELRALGDTPDAIRERFVRDVLVPELLYSEEAARQKLSAKPATRDHVREALRRALERELRTKVESSNEVTDEHVRRYYEAHQRDYHAPRRIRIWRILVETEEQAKAVIAAARGAKGIERWSQLAREQSLDTATKMRKGDLGFVHPDGKTDAPEVHVEPALYAAAAEVRDGEIVAKPLEEKDKLAVVWRRGTLDAMARELPEVAPSIRELLIEQRVAKRRAALLKKLEAEHVELGSPELVEHVDVPAFGSAAQRRRAQIVKPRPAESPPRPSASGPAHR